MGFIEKVEEKEKHRKARPPELTVKDWISFYDLLYSARTQYPDILYEDLTSVLLTTLSDEHHPELYRQVGDKLNDVAGDHFARGLAFERKKVEYIHGEHFASQEMMRRVVFNYIEYDYNR